MTPQTQQAWIVERQGLPKDALRLHPDWPVPDKPEKGEVLVKVQAVALNPLGYKLMKLLPNWMTKRPYPPEYDLSGVIEDGNDSEFHAGDEVFGFIPADKAAATKQGALQQYARVPANALALRPRNVTPTEAAGFTLAAQTAWQALFKAGGFEAGQTILVNGASSSVGAFTVQIAKAKGAGRIVATASEKNEDFVRSLGADEFIDYTKEPLHKYLTKNPPSPKFHMIFDAVGLTDPALFTHCAAYLAPGGVFVSSGPVQGLRPFVPIIKTAFAISWPAWLGGIPRTYKIILVKHNPSDFKQLVQLVEEGKLKPIVDSVYGFDDALAAYERIMSRRARGKVVLKVDPATT
ncbi:hypothetical protein CPB85DRAFT_1215370 [Mucidula mucida]|nr:hypothetical protein CPB85DRAFT_1215370 [Mucidula mucida]